MRNVTLTKVDGFTAFRTVRHGWLDRCSRMGYNSKWQPTDRCLLYSDQPEHRSVFDVTGTPDQCHEPLCVTWKFFSKRASKAYKILSVFRRDNHTRNGMRTIASIIKTETESQVIFLCKIRRKKKKLCFISIELIVVTSTVSISTRAGDGVEKQFNVTMLHITFVLDKTIC